MFPIVSQWNGYLLRPDCRFYVIIHSFAHLLYICIKDMMSLADQGLEDITNAILEELSASCTECGITNDIIDKQSFACFPESPTYVTYRARLEGTSETDSGSLISLIEEWVSGGTSINVTGVLMTVDSEYSVAISSLSEVECSLPVTNSTTTTENSNTTAFPTLSTAIIGGIVAVILIISLTLLAMALIMNIRQRGIATIEE